MSGDDDSRCEACASEKRSGSPVPWEHHSCDAGDPPKLPDGVRISVRHENVGPREDQYSRVHRTVWLADGRCVTLTTCALAMGSWLVVDGDTVREISDRDPDAEQDFTSLTGLSPYDVDWHNNEEWERRDEVRAAERAAGWDPKP